VKYNDACPLAFEPGCDVCREKGKYGNGESQEEGQEANKEIGGPQAAEKQLQEGGFDQDGQSQPPEEFYRRDTEGVAEEGRFLCHTELISIKQ
jgi:hypothetical protein